MHALDSTKKKVPVSVLIPVKNEAGNLPRCLSSVLWADEIYVVDSHSTDETQKVAEAYGATVIQFDFSGTWPKKKNWALEALPFRNSWVFILDADEVLPIGAGDEINAIVTRDESPGDPVGYWINRRFFFLGRWLRHAYFPNWNLRLFKHALGRYEKLTEADTQSGDNEVHEHVIVDGKTARLHSLMDHYAFPSVASFVEKHNRYSNWESRVELVGASQAEAGPAGSAGRRRLLRKWSRVLPCRPLMRFLYVYIWQLGFLDGSAGFHFAMLHAFYEYLIVLKIAELKQRQHTAQGNVET